MARGLIGADKLSSRLLKAEVKSLTALAAGLYKEAIETMAESAMEVPVDLGILRASGTVNPPEISGNGVSVTFGYGGAASDYAIPQHEREDYSHTVGKAKYLEDPLMRRANGMERRMGATVQAQLRI